MPAYYLKAFHFFNSSLLLFGLFRLKIQISIIIILVHSLKQLKKECPNTL